MKEENIREVIIAEYLAGGTSYRILEAKYDVGRNTIFRWVTQHKSGMGTRSRKKRTKPIEPEPQHEPLPADVQELQLMLKQAKSQLRQADLKAKFLDALIDNAEKDYGIAIRKKAGSRQ